MFSFRKLLPLLLLLGSCWAQTVTAVGSNFVSGGTSVKVPSSGTVSVNSGHLLIGFVLSTCTTNHTGDSSSTFSDTLGNSWTTVSGGAVSGGGCTYMFYTCNSTGGNDTFTASNTTSGSDIHLHVMDVSSIQTSSCLDKSGVLNGATGTTITVSTSAAITSSTEQIIAFFGDWITNSTWTVTSGNTQKATTANSATGDSAATESKNSTSGLSLAVQSISVTNGTSGDTKVAVIGAFLASAGGSTCTHPIALTGVGCR